MPQVSFMMLAQETAKAGPPDPRVQILGWWALWMLILIVILLLMVIAMLSLVLSRRRRSQYGQPRRESPASVDPWIEAGRRMKAPDAAPATAEDSTDPKLAVDVLSGQRPIALVTGGVRRVGRSTCLALARAGCDILCTYHSSDEDAATLAAELRKLGVGVVLHKLDLLDLDAVELFASYVAETLPRLDVLVHNASVYAATPLHDLATQEAVQQLSINALSPLILTAKLAPLLRHSQLTGGGAIVAMADIHAMGRPRKDFIAYSMSKAALVELVYSAARELGPHVRVNGVAPGVVAWPEAGVDADEAAQAAYLRRVPLERAGTPQDAAEAVRWLALDAHYTTGQIIRVDGGRWST
jgi:pteridine reductase